MLGDHCLTFKAAKFEFRNIWPYLSLFGLYGLGGQIPSIAFLCQNGLHKAKKGNISIKLTSGLDMAYHKA